MNSTSSGSRSRPPFFNYIKPYMVYFKGTQKILKEDLRFIRNSESKRKFFNHIKPSIVYFKDTQKILRENLRFIRNSELKREFFKKYPQVNFFLLGSFLVLIFKF